MAQKLSELIANLQGILQEEGDIPCRGKFDMCNEPARLAIYLEEAKDGSVYLSLELEYDEEEAQ